MGGASLATGILSSILATMSIFLSIIPGVGLAITIVGVIIGILAIILGIFAIKSGRKGLGFAAVISGGIGLLLSAMMMVAAISITMTMNEYMEDYANDDLLSEPLLNDPAMQQQVNEELQRALEEAMREAQ
jgi:uncharacterized protein (DUF697 family)